MTDTEAVNAIFDLLEKDEWEASDLDEIGAIVQATGRRFTDWWAGDEE